MLIESLHEGFLNSDQIECYRVQDYLVMAEAPIHFMDENGYDYRSSYILCQCESEAQARYVLRQLAKAVPRNDLYVFISQDFFGDWKAEFDKPEKGGENDG